MPNPPPRSSSGSSAPSSLLMLGVQREHPPGRHLEAGRVEDLAADVAVQPEQVEARCVEHPAYGVEGLAVADREAELLVLVGGGDVLVGVRLDAGGHAHHDGLGPAEPLGDLGQPLDLLEGVDDDPADAEGDRLLELGQALVVAVEADPGHVEAGPLGHRQLAAGADVEVEPLLRGPAGGGGAEERLAGVEDVVVGEGLAEGTGAGPEVGLVEDVRRRAVLRDQVGEAHSPDAEDTVHLVRGLRPEMADQGVGVGRLAEPGRGPQRAGRVGPAGLVGAWLTFAPGP